MVRNYRFLALVGLLCVLLSNTALAQEPNYSLYRYTPFFTNPGQIGTIEDVRLMLNYRNQSLEAGESFNSTSVSAFYPINIKNHRLVIGADFLSDKASQYVNTNGGLIGVAYSIKLNQYSELSLGVQGGFFQRKIGGEFTTDDQFVNGGFDPSLISEDGVLNQTKAYPTLSGGVYYKIKDEFGEDKAFIGASVFNAIEPDISFIEATSDKLPMSLKVLAGYKVYQGERFSVLPNMRWVNQAGNSFFNLGSNFDYALSTNEDGRTALELGAWYNTNEAGIVSVAYKQPRLTIGAGYEMPLGDGLNSARNGTFELAISFRLKKKSQPYQEPVPAAEPVAPVEETEPVAEEPEEPVEEGRIEEQKVLVEEETEEEPVEKKVEEEEEIVVEETPEPKKSVLTPREKELMEKTVRFNLNSDDLTADSKDFLDKVVEILKEKDDFQIRLTGYTCSLGPESFNESLAQDRAEIVSTYLINNGIDKNRITVDSGGENNPIGDNNTQEGRIKNRRVEFTLSY